MKNNNPIYLRFIFVLTIGLSACNKFLDILPSTTSVNPTKIKDFEEMLNTDSLALPQFFLFDLASDDLFITENQLFNRTSYFAKTYLWEQQIWNDDDVDLTYNNAYSRILQMNIILNRIDDAPVEADDHEGRKSIAVSQALINRAWYYLQLANGYGKAYDPATATTDLGVPLILSPDPDQLPERASLQVIYDQIIGDLQKAVSNNALPDKGVDIIHPGKAAGYALLARTFLLQGNYDLAERYADSTLALQNTLSNYNEFDHSVNQLVALRNNPEVLLGRLTNERQFFEVMNGTIQISRSLKDSLGTVDRRYTRPFSSDLFRTTGIGPSTTLVFNQSINTPEVLLIKAECLARKGDVDGAAAIVDLIRRNRIPPTNLTQRTYNATNILPYVLGERRRELFFKGGLRLFDLKRLNKEERFRKDLTRYNNMNNDSVMATLPAGSPRYIMPFAPAIINNNNHIIQNQR